MGMGLRDEDPIGVAVANVGLEFQFRLFNIFEKEKRLDLVHLKIDLGALNLDQNKRTIFSSFTSSSCRSL